MRALLTGGTGFIGVHLARHLAQSGWTVAATVRPDSRPARVGLLRSAGCEIQAVDDSTATVVAVVAASRPDVVLHLATKFVGEHVVADIDGLMQSNVTFGTQLLEGIRAASRGALVCIGTHWQHYENKEYSPVSLYAATKQAFEDIAQYYAEVASIPVVALHPSDCYGPGDERKKLLHRLLEAARTGVTLDLSPGEQSIDLLHVDDLVRAIAIAARRAAAPHAGPRFERFSVRSGRSLTIRELVALLEHVRGSAIPVRWGARPYRARETFGAWTSGAPLPGWSPSIALESGIATLD